MILKQSLKREQKNRAEIAISLNWQAVSEKLN